VNICHVTPHLPPDQAANALLPAELGASSVAAGHSVSFVSQPPAQGGTSLESSMPGPVARIAGRSPERWKQLSRVDTAMRARSIMRALDEVAAGADLLHLHSNGLIVEIAALWSRRRRTPYVLTLYGTEIWHYRRRWLIDLFTRAYFGAADVTFYSRKLMERAVEIGLHRDRLAVVYPAVSAVFRPLDQDARDRERRSLGIAEARVILNVKRLHPLAAQSDLIAAFAALSRRHDDVRLIICGTGPLAAALSAQAQRLGVAPKVTFTGLLPNADVARYAAVADVFALPSRLEALPTVAVEALAAGTPVVSADHPGGVELHSIFGDDVTLVKQGDVSALEQALSARMLTPRRAHPRTLELVEHHFGSRPIQAAYEAIYRHAIL
jgi:glycosyltransferase involved in cell wall biosynthesis